jgi:hypothetical protein
MKCNGVLRLSRRKIAAHLSGEDPNKVAIIIFDGTLSYRHNFPPNDLNSNSIECLVPPRGAGIIVKGDGWQLKII